MLVCILTATGSPNSMHKEVEAGDEGWAGGMQVHCWGLAISVCIGVGQQLEVGLNICPQAAVGPWLYVCSSRLQDLTMGMHTVVDTGDKS